jgi:hypothetical protein
MQSISDFIRFRGYTQTEFCQANPGRFLVIRVPDEGIEKQTFAFQTRAILPANEGPLAEMEELRKEGKPPKPEAMRLLVFPVEKRPGSAFASRVSIGRTEQCDITIPDSRISKLHAYLEADSTGSYVLVDNGSRNGTKVNGRPLTPNTRVPIAVGAVLEFGTFSFNFVDGAYIYSKLSQVAISPVQSTAEAAVQRGMS